MDARRSSRVEGLGSITISFIQDLLGATDGEGEDEVRIVNLDVVEFLYTTLKLALGVTPIDGFDLLEGVVRATESLEELEVRIRKEREDERNLFIQRIHQLEGNEAREVDKIMKDLRLGRWAVRGKVGYDPEQVAREMIEAEAFGRDL